MITIAITSPAGPALGMRVWTISAAAPIVALALTTLLPATAERRRLEPEVAVL